MSESISVDGSAVPTYITICFFTCPNTTHFPCYVIPFITWSFNLLSSHEEQKYVLGQMAYCTCSAIQ